MAYKGWLESVAAEQAAKAQREEAANLILAGSPGVHRAESVAERLRMAQELLRGGTASTYKAACYKQQLMSQLNDDDDLAQKGGGGNVSSRLPSPPPLGISSSFSVLGQPVSEHCLRFRRHSTMSSLSSLD